MPTTFPATKAEGRPKQSDEAAAEPRVEQHGAQPVAHPGSNAAPTFALLDQRGPRPGALVASCALLSAMLLVAAALGRPPRTVRAVSEVAVSSTPLWLPPNPPSADAEGSAGAEQEPPDESIDPPATSPPFTPPAQAPAEHHPPAASTAPPLLSVLPLRPSDAFSRFVELTPPAPTTGQAAVAAIPKPEPGALGTVPLPQLLERQAALAASLAELSPDERQALPQVSIRVNAEWLEALPQTQERLYFSPVRPRPDSLVLAYSPVTRTFTLERPLQPLWQIRDAQQVPALAALRAAAARRLAVSPELVGLYTWHPPALESALRMFVASRVKQTGAHLGSHDVVTVRLALGASGFVMNLEPLRAADPR